MKLYAKIWPIKAAYKNEKGKVGGKLGIKKSLDYVLDPEKITTEEDYVKREIDYINNEKDLGRVINYMANEDKTKKTYVTGYMCDPMFAVQQFMDAKEEVCRKIGRDMNEDKGNVAYHIVQSFPMDQDISDEEIHQCGVELCKKLGVHQAVITSHLRPAVGKDGELHGQQKHNHILINSYIHPDFIDLEHPKRVKYNDCKETYAQLQIWNDEIALEHGFPIITEPEQNKYYSWYENQQINEGKSWKERIRVDINNAKYVSTNWDEFKEKMIASGYQLREGKYVTFIAPDKVHKARGNTLGPEFTKEYLSEYWQLRKDIQKSVQEEVKDNFDSEEKENLKVMLQIPDLQVFVKIPVKKKWQPDKSYDHFYPINENTSTDEKVLSSYFSPDEKYILCDEKHQKLGEITGKNLIEFLAQKEHLKDFNHNKHKEQQKDKQEQSQDKKSEYSYDNKQENKYYQKNRYNTRTKKYYSINLYDAYGRKRSTLELMLLLAIVIIKNENDTWNKEQYTEKANPKSKDFVPVYGRTDWKIQNMVDALHVAREQNLTTPKEIEDKLDAVGLKIGRTRFQLNKTEKTIRKMESIHDAIVNYEAVKTQCEAIFKLQDEEARERLTAQHSNEISQYKASKAVLYKYKIVSDENIAEFKTRWESINEHRDTLKDNLDRVSEEYRQLKKLKVHTDYSLDDRYCYGPDFVYDRSIWERTKSEPEVNKGLQLEAILRRYKEKDNRPRTGNKADVELDKRN